MPTTIYTPDQLRSGTRAVEIPAGSSTDPDAQAFFTSAGITDTTQQTAVNNLVVGLKNDGIWNKMKIIYPFVGGTATSHSYNLKDTTVAQITWTSGITHNSNGVDGANSGTAHGDTGITPSALGLGRNDTSFGFYTPQGWVVNQQFPLGIYSGNTSITIYKAGGTPGSLYLMVNDALSGTNVTAPTPLTGFHQLTRTESTEVRYKKDNETVITKSATSGADPSTTKNLWVLAANGYTQSGYGSITSFTYFGLGLTDTELNQMNTLVTAYQTELSREV